MAYSTKNYLSQLSTKSQTRGHSLSPQRQRTYYLGALLVVDVIMLKLAFALAHWIRFSPGLDNLFEPGMVAPERYAFFSLVFIGFWILLFALFRAYDWENLLGGTEEYALVAHACTFATVGVMVTNFLWPFVIARGWLLLAWVLTFFFVAVGRFTLRHMAYRLRTYGYFVAPALIVGNNDEGQALADQLTTWRTSGLNIVGIVDNQMDQEGEENDIPVLGDLTELPEIVEQHRVEELILTTSALSPQQIL
jgi:FlaA1/EpsC-like NDP-sugar epimerase